MRFSLMLWFQRFNQGNRSAQHVAVAIHDAVDDGIDVRVVIGLQSAVSFTAAH